MSAQSMIDIAYRIMSEKSAPVNFKDLWKEVTFELGLDAAKAAKKISLFYSDLSLDGRFVALKDNNWELKRRLKFEDVYIDTSSIVIDDSDLDEDEFSEEDKEIDNVSMDDY